MIIYTDFTDFLNVLRTHQKFQETLGQQDVLWFDVAVDHPTTVEIVNLTTGRNNWNLYT